jgi:uncharacterized protein (DUF1501 family)
VVVQLEGGNDGLNTVVPYRDDDYRRLRPTLRQEAGTLHRIDDSVGFHRGLGGFSALLESGRLAIVQGVGYPNPNRSHFESMAIWQTARTDPGRETPGWLARWLDARAAAPVGDAPALHIGGAPLPQALAGSSLPVPSLDRPGQFRRRLGMPGGTAAVAQREALDALARRVRGVPGSLVQFVERCTLVGYASGARLEAALGVGDRPEGYPGGDLARRLALIARLIKAELTTPLYYARQDGFDTHAAQLGPHEGLLRDLGEALRAFLDDLDGSGHGDRVLVLVFSEFGRRAAENGSGGTDHGTAAPVFVLGRGVQSGLIGPYPNLSNLVDGDPMSAIDFRRVYATLLDGWLRGATSRAVLGRDFEALALLRA